MVNSHNHLAPQAGAVGLAYSEYCIVLLITDGTDLAIVVIRPE